MDFSDFISAFALVAIAFTVTDTRYIFRIRIAPIPLYLYIFVVLVLMGVFTLINGNIANSPYPLLNWLANKGNPLGLLFGWFFWVLTLAWVWYAYLFPPTFNKFNYKKYVGFIYRAIIQGNDEVLSVVANELSESARPIIKYSENVKKNSNLSTEATSTCKKFYCKFFEKFLMPKSNISAYAYDLILLIGNRKFCKNIAMSTPGTAIAFFYWISKTNTYNLPIGQFAKNITVEMLKNKDSTLYHEDHGFYSGLLGYAKPFSTTVYGDYILLENLSTDHNSPLDIDYRFVNNFDADQLNAYCRIVSIALNGYIRSFSQLGNRCYALKRAITNIESSCKGLYKINEMSSDYYMAETVKKIDVAVDFLCGSVETLNQNGFPLRTKLRLTNIAHSDIYDCLASTIFEIIYEASCVNKNTDVCWHIHYISTWSKFFNSIYQEPSWKIIRFKLRRLIFDEIKRMDKIPNYKSAKILGLCLNVMGFETHKNLDENSGVLPLKNIILNWTRKNFLKVRAFNPEISDTFLVGSIWFDQENNRLVKDYLKSLDATIPREFLYLET